MKRQPISFEDWKLRPCDHFANRWWLLACGDFSTGRFNAMTIAWGSIGRMWEKPFVQVVVRPTRYTFEFMERYDTFTLSAFPEKLKPILSLLGTKTGRNTDKMGECGLTPAASARVDAPSFREAELSLECRKIYWDDFDPVHFIGGDLSALYPQKDYHRVYFGEILAISGTPAYK